MGVDRAPFHHLSAGASVASSPQHVRPVGGQVQADRGATRGAATHKGDVRELFVVDELGHGLEQAPI